MNRDADTTPGGQLPLPERRAVTDSPWFWVLMFSGMAYVALLAMDHKFGRRQSQVEGPFKTREYNVSKAAGRAPADPAEVDFDVDYSAPERTIISLGPLRMLALAILCVSAVMLTRGRLVKFFVRNRQSSTTSPDERSR